MKKELENLDSRIDAERWRTGAFRRSLLAWYRREGRKFPWRTENASRYEFVVSEILLQRTRAETVSKFFPSFIKRFRRWEDLARASERDLRAFLIPIGLWKRRAAALRSLGRKMSALNGKFPRQRSEIECLPGVGQYIASAVLLFCHRGREPLLDANMARVLERCFGSRKLADIRYDPWLQAISRAVVAHPRAIEINWGVLDLAAKVCFVNEPDCAKCPVRRYCRYAAGRGQPNKETHNGKARRRLPSVEAKRGSGVPPLP